MITPVDCAAVQMRLLAIHSIRCPKRSGADEYLHAWLHEKA